MSKIVKDWELNVLKMIIDDLTAAEYRLEYKDCDGERVIIADSSPRTLEEIYDNGIGNELHIDCFTVKRGSLSFVLLVWGNECDILSDYGMSIAPHLTRVIEHCKAFED